MRIVTWNCNGGFWRKHSQLATFCADVLVIQECNDPARSKSAVYRDWAGSSFAWVGQSATKGLGIFARNGASIVQQPFALAPRYFLPVTIGNIPICGVWAHTDPHGARHYCGQTYAYLSSQPAWLADPHSLFVGDLNSNRIWDKPNRQWNHSATVQILNDQGLESAYHNRHQSGQGAELHPSFYLHRNTAKPYHIDYVFHGPGWQTDHCEIGAPDPWLAHSDHMPVLVDLSLARPLQTLPILPTLSHNPTNY